MDNLPPHSEVAERGVLGAALRWPTGIDYITGTIEPASMYLAHHRDIFAAVLDLHAAGKPVDLVTVHERLKGLGGDFNYAAYLADLWDATPTGANLEHYAKIVRDKAVQRALIRVGNVIVRDAQDGVQPPDELLADAEVALAQLRLQGGRGELPATLDQTIDAVVKRIDSRASKPDSGAILTGFDRLDQMTSGYHPGELIVVAARTGQGKSIYAQTVAMFAAKAGKRVLVFSLEMTHVDVGQRILINESDVQGWKVRSSKLNPVDVQRLAEAAERLRGLGVRIDDEPGITLSRIVTKSRLLKRREGLDLVIVDYVGLVRPSNPRLPRHEQIAEISRGLKVLAQEIQAPVMMLSQLNRASETENRQPRLSDIAASSGIEADADTVLLLHRPTDDAGDTIPIDFIIAKQRNGETGLIRMMYTGGLFRFTGDIPRI